MNIQKKRKSLLDFKMLLFKKEETLLFKKERNTFPKKKASRKNCSPSF
jgi:hypothetical protein